MSIALSRPFQWFLTLLVGGMMLFSFAPAHALESYTAACDGYDPNDPFGVECGQSSGLSDRDPRLIAGYIINVALSLLGIIFVALIVYAGFRWMTSAGNQDSIDTARKILFGAVIGLIVILVAYALSNFILEQLADATGVEQV